MPWPEVQAFWHFMAIYGILAFLPKSLIRNQIRFFQFYPIFSDFSDFIRFFLFLDFSQLLDFQIPQLYSAHLF